MSCQNPILALHLGDDPETGKMRIKFIPPGENLKSLEYRYGYLDIVALPCGKCLACKEQYRKYWTERCILESKKHDHNFFLTLTYDELHNPGKLRRGDLTVFIREVRRDRSFRYFGCGEYGEQGFRPHYHLIAFGLNLNDLKFYGYSDNGVPLYNSKFLEDKWKNGLVMVEEFHPNNAAYVAGYVHKKLGKQGPFDDAPEFICMSNRPGIGHDGLLERKDEFLQYGHLVGPSGRIMRLGRYAGKVVDIPREVKQENLKALRISENQAMNLLKVVNREELWYRRSKDLEDRVKHRRRKKC